MQANSLAIFIAVTLVWSGACQCDQMVAEQQQTTSSTTSSSGQQSDMVQLDDPSNSAATTTTSDNDDTSVAAAADDVCVQCYDKVKLAQDLINVHADLLRKQKKMMNRIQAALEVSTLNRADSDGSRTTIHLPRSWVPTSNQLRRDKTTTTITTTTTTSPSSVSSRSVRTLLASAGQNEPIVVSTLRVARSPAAAIEQYQQARSTATGGAQSGSNKFALNKKNLALERLKKEQQRHTDLTCKALLEVRDCLDLLSRECIGNLQFHSYEVFSDQWYSKLRCPYPNNPSLKPLPSLLPRSIGSSESESSFKVPIPRPISSDDEVRQRLQKILPDPPRFQRHQLGVMLKPTVNQQQQLQFKGSSYQSLMRDYHPLISNVAGTQQRHTDQMVSVSNPASSNKENSLNLVNLGKLLLVPCGFAIMVALLLVASLRYRLDDNEHDEVEADEAPSKVRPPIMG